MPVMSLLEHGAVAFVQLGESPTSRSWGMIRTLNGAPVDTANLRELIEGSETGTFTAHTQANLLVDNAVPSYLRYQLIADFPMVHMPEGGDVHAAVCAVWPQGLPAEMQSLIPASNRTHGSTQMIPPGAFSQWPDTVLGHVPRSLDDLQHWANQRDDAACSVVRAYYGSG